ncbi:hypothetical protein HHK36_027004 [Tetracentron sinense]|uniref:Uncharacterized protein n=1 Tax=Tetracentron sinense TaxID=13715 RepID=A0A835D2M8_TETSI|nr:hypothetical protein HHK36_027004 [Tetracentron sinense]
MQNSPTTPIRENRNLYCFLPTFLVSLFFILSFSSSSITPSSSSVSASYPFTFPNRHHLSLIDPNHTHSTSPPPSIAYLISGSNGDSPRILRLLFAIYHPRNQYLLHLDRTAPQSQRDELALSVQSVAVFRAAQNVNVVGKADFANPRGSSSIAATLHGAAILLRFSVNWDWFINLSAADYPLITQDDLLHILSFLPRDLNFVNHSSHIGWRESHRLKPIIVDPGLYLSDNSDVFYVTQKRELPNSYRLFTGELMYNLFLSSYNLGVISYAADEDQLVNGLALELAISPIMVWLKYSNLPVDMHVHQIQSTLIAYVFIHLLKQTETVMGGGGSSPSAILSRKFVEFCILGPDNLPRTLLMYLSNTVSQGNYFPTILCNSRQFNRTTVNHNLQYVSFDNSPKQEPRTLGLNDFNEMIRSGAAFGTQFLLDDPVLDRIDREVLNRSPGSTVPGGWCLGESDNDMCSVWGDADILRPGPGARRLERYIVKLLSNKTFRSHQCLVE